MPILLCIVLSMSAWTAPLPASQCVGSTRSRAAEPQANFFNQAKEVMAYKMKHVGTMCTVQQVVVATFDELNEMEAEVKEAGSTFEAMSECAKRNSLDKASADKDGLVGPFMLGQKEAGFVCV